MSKPCKFCGGTDHTGFTCRNRERKPMNKISKKRLENPPPPKIRKPMNKVGKSAKKHAKTSNTWKELNPPDHQGYWYCLIGGAALSDKSDSEVLPLNVCHKQSKARRKDLQEDQSNLFPGCPGHNKEQGSKSLEEYLAGPHKINCSAI